MLIRSIHNIPGTEFCMSGLIIPTIWQAGQYYSLFTDDEVKAGGN